MLVWGDRDPILPVAHARATAEAMPDVRLEVLPGAGHQPHRSDPRRFTEVLEQFLDTTSPATHDPLDWRRRLVDGPAADAAPPVGGPDLEGPGPRGHGLGSSGPVRGSSATRPPSPAGGRGLVVRSSRSGAV